MADDSSCSLCGVAYDVGYKHCREKQCELLVLKEHPHLARTVQPVVKKTLSRSPASLDPAYSRHNSIKNRASKKSLAFDLSLEDVAEIIYGECVYCGSRERIEVDRKVPALGYTKANTCPACHRCNTLKNNVATYEEMMSIALALRWRECR